MLQEGVVELGAMQCAQTLHRGGVVLCALIVRRRRGCDTKLLREIATLLAHGLMIAGEHRSKVADLFRRSLLSRERTGLDVRRVGLVENRDDGRVVERLYGDWRWGGARGDRRSIGQSN